MTEKMKYVNIMGNMKDLDRVIEKYISKYEIQLEYTSKELANEKDLTNIQSPNPYSNIYKRAGKLFNIASLEEKAKDCQPTYDITGEDAVKTIESTIEHMENMSNELGTLMKKREEYLKIINEYEPFIDLEFDVDNLRQFKYIKYKFGKMPLSSFKQFEAFLYDQPQILFVSGKRDTDFVWGVYFVVDSFKDKTSSIFSSLHFEKMELTLSLEEELLHGRPLDVYNSFKAKLKRIEEQIAAMDEAKLLGVNDKNTGSVDKVFQSYKKIRELASLHDLRKYAAKTSNDFYIFVGWMIARDARELEKELNNDDEVIFIVEESNQSIVSKPPTKLRNTFLTRPFELFVRMYGLPAYDEIDPTPFVAITYTILFGVMFGDVGQGIILSFLGLYLYKAKNMKLGSIMAIIGASSTVFGLLFGSVFGFEFHPLWMHPAEPDNINTILLYAVGFGIFLIFMAMAANVLNAIKKKQYRRIIFDPNGLMGLIFYGAVIGIAYFSLTERVNIAFWMIIAFIILPLLLMAFREPILKFLRGKKEVLFDGKGMFLFETVVEAFELVLSYFTNTVSFVRVGAFALSHASMMGVVMMLSTTSTGSRNIVVIILGNILIMVLEGLIVGIQVLRLEFYEMFSRFYSGTGREFIPHKKIYE